jgi:hypothetical protein
LDDWLLYGDLGLGRIFPEEYINSQNFVATGLSPLNIFTSTNDSQRSTPERAQQNTPDQDPDDWILSGLGANDAEKEPEPCLTKNDFETEAVTNTKDNKDKKEIEVSTVELFSIEVMGLDTSIEVSVFERKNTNVNIQEETEDKPKLTALQKHRQKKKLAGLQLERNLKEIDTEIQNTETNILFLRGNINLLDEICGSETDEVIDQQSKIENEKELNELFKIRKEVQTVRPPNNDSERQKHQRGKRKRLLELEGEELSLKKKKRIILLNEKKYLISVLRFKKNAMKEKYKDKM